MRRNVNAFDRIASATLAGRMLHRDVVFEGWTATDWSRLVALFEPVRKEPREPSAPQGGIVAVHDRGRLRKLVHTRAGRLDTASEPWPVALADLAARHHASWAFAMQLGALDELMERFGARARREDDLTAQTLSVAGIVRELMQERLLESWPRRLEGVPIPAGAIVESTLDALCPNGSAMVVGLFDRGEPWTAIALSRRFGLVDRIVGPDALRADMGLLSGDWRRDYRHLARAVELHVAPIALGCFTEVATLRALEVDPSPGAWARAVAVRDVIVSPLPPALAIPLGFDAARASFAAVRKLAERFDPIGVVPPLADAVVRTLREAMEALEPRREGKTFDPLDALRRILSR